MYEEADANTLDIAVCAVCSADQRPARGGSNSIVGVWGDGMVSLWDVRSQQVSEVARLPKPAGKRHKAGACVASWKVRCCHCNPCG